MTPAAFLTAFAEALANDGALTLLIVFILILGARKTWVWGYQLTEAKTQLTDERIDFLRQLNEMREERDTWRRMSLMQQGQHGPERPPDEPQRKEPSHD